MKRNAKLSLAELSDEQIEKKMRCGNKDCSLPSSSNFRSVINLFNNNYKYIHFCSQECKTKGLDQRCVVCHNEEHLFFHAKEGKHFCISHSFVDCYSRYKGFNTACSLCHKLLQRDFDSQQAQEQENTKTFFCRCCQEQLSEVQRLEGKIKDIRLSLVNRLHNNQINYCVDREHYGCSCTGKTIVTKADLELEHLSIDDDKSREIFNSKLQTD